ncbi:DUF3526 domain-containing protein [Cupriavidus sp. DL-D2]|uniref:DUF3526 domain-containing protein n=1 Tax=Cupriavidus sp. DL-D2 TaxID=3144974 RepID=UPI0032120FA5
MIRAIVVKEMRAQWREGRMPMLWLLGVGLIGLILLVSVQRWERLQQEIAQVEAATRQQWDEQGANHPHRAAHFGLYAFRPTSTLSIIEPGLSDYFGQALWLEPHRRNVGRFEPAQDALPSIRFGDVSAGFLLATLLPLLVIALTYDIIGAERQSGTLRMLYANGMRRRAWIAGKIAMPMLCLASLVTMAMAAALWLTGSSGTRADLARTLTMGAAYLAYAMVLVGIGVAVSIRVSASRAALLVLLAFWLVTTVAIPAVAAGVAARVAPLPTAQSFWSAIERDYQQGLPGDGDLATRGLRYDKALLTRYGVSRLDDLPVGAAAMRRLARDAYADRVHTLHFDALWKRYQRHEDMMRMAALFSPALAVRNLAMKMAGTDLSHQRHYDDAAEHYRRVVNRTIDEWDVAHSRGMPSSDARYADAALWRAIPPFTYTSPSAAFAWRSALPEIAMLAAWGVMVTLGLVWSMRRMRP